MSPLSHAHIPYGGYWSTPFCRWQGALAHSHSVELAAQSAKRFLTRRNIDSRALDGLVLGLTVPQRHSFYGAPWLAGMLDAPALTGPTVSQACATSARLLATAAAEVEFGQARVVMGVACDRTSNGPQVLYPNPRGIGGMAEIENWVWDSFHRDPHARNAMIETAENVAAAAKISRQEQEAMALLRAEQYQAALAEHRAFQRRYMLAVEISLGKQKSIFVDVDEGIHETTREGLTALQPLRPEGTVTFGTQTHPADGNAGILVCDADEAKSLSRDPNVTIRIVSFAEARVAKGMMPQAAVPAAKAALARAGVGLPALAAVKTHNPFAVSDVYFCRQMELPAERVNNYGSSLIYGHPQAPTGLRAIIELIEELVTLGGGYGLFSGCAAGDSAMAVVLKVG